MAKFFWHSSGIGPELCQARSPAGINHVLIGEMEPVMKTCGGFSESLRCRRGADRFKLIYKLTRLERFESTSAVWLLMLSI